MLAKFYDNVKQLVSVQFHRAVLYHYAMDIINLDDMLSHFLILRKQKQASPKGRL